MSFGVAFSVRANLGISPISCIPYVLSLGFPLTIGEFTIIFNVALILLQIIILRKRYRLFQLVQLPVTFLFGFFIDFALLLLAGLDVDPYFLRLAFCLLSCLLIGLGVCIEVRADVTYLPGEGLALAISQTFNNEFGKVKVGNDSAMVVIGIVLSFIFLSELQGIREGTVIAALLVGIIARHLNRILPGHIIKETGSQKQVDYNILEA